MVQLGHHFMLQPSCSIVSFVAAEYLKNVAKLVYKLEISYQCDLIIIIYVAFTKTL